MAGGGGLGETVHKSVSLILNKKDKEAELKARLKAHLYSKQPLFGKDSPFSDLL
jgi:hypothetical protein